MKEREESLLQDSHHKREMMICEKSWISGGLPSREAADEEGGEVGGAERDKSNSLAIETSAPPPVDK